VHGQDQEQELGRLRWRCRRGMKELDTLLTRWLEQSYGVASSQQQRVFREFLELPDPEIAGYLLGRESPGDSERTQLVAALVGARPDALPSHRS
jgi:antitoxin CptB